MTDARLGRESALAVLIAASRDARLGRESALTGLRPSTREARNARLAVLVLVRAPSSFVGWGIPL